jgi:MFS-type transporter involved in bile tolerance (Atg22 family)
MKYLEISFFIVFILLVLMGGLCEKLKFRKAQEFFYILAISDLFMLFIIVMKNLR